MNTNGNHLQHEWKNDPDPQQKKAAASPRKRRWIKGLLVSGLLFASFVAGLMIGYGILGKAPIGEVFDPKTYKHMYDLIFSGT